MAQLTPRKQRDVRQGRCRQQGREVHPGKTDGPGLKHEVGRYLRDQVQKRIAIQQREEQSEGVVSRTVGTSAIRADGQFVIEQDILQYAERPPVGLRKDLGDDGPVAPAPRAEVAVQQEATVTLMLRDLLESEAYDVLSPAQAADERVVLRAPR